MISILVHHPQIMLVHVLRYTIKAINRHSLVISFRLEVNKRKEMLLVMFLRKSSKPPILKCSCADTGDSFPKMRNERLLLESFTVPESRSRCILYSKNDNRLGWANSCRRTTTEAAVIGNKSIPFDQMRIERSWAQDKSYWVNVRPLHLPQLVQTLLQPTRDESSMLPKRWALSPTCFSDTRGAGDFNYTERQKVLKCQNQHLTTPCEGCEKACCLVDMWYVILYKGREVY